MASVRGVHIIAKGERGEARRIAVDIRQHNRFLIGTNSFFGAGVYAWYEEHLPENLRDAPQVLFEIDDSRIDSVVSRAGVPSGFFRIPGRIGDYVPIRVIRFANL